MPPTPLLALRPTVPDGTILQKAWNCNQSTVSRRMTSLWNHNLIEYRTGRGEYLVRRLGPVTP